ncbi:hypothetical protein [Rubripirellula reticaptiva]|uniref:J domain-containing protein n=1 Tax=Rubripirellula reticaptiva TaxID=2528013 RepID=A0A5C6FCN2_9BACT|nr:hypothetical protein [Rubripirellula reticaptiva]TWU57399.1 hypothetical protein Poly59_03060 [Rubripirellula reticaptiva]
MPDLPSSDPPPFDPLEEWLGIPSDQQPPNLYRLLGVELFESNVDLMNQAADRHLSELHFAANGPHAEVAESISNQVSLARLTLCDEVKKARYDADLRRELEGQAVRDEVPPVLSDLSLPMPVDSDVAILGRADAVVVRPQRRAFRWKSAVSQLVSVFVLLVLPVSLFVGSPRLRQAIGKLLLPVTKVAVDVSPADQGNAVVHGDPPLDVVSSTGPVANDLKEESESPLVSSPNLVEPSSGMHSAMASESPTSTESMSTSTKQDPVAADSDVENSMTDRPNPVVEPERNRANEMLLRSADQMASSPFPLVSEVIGVKLDIDSAKRAYRLQDVTDQDQLFVEGIAGVVVSSKISPEPGELSFDSPTEIVFDDMYELKLELRLIRVTEDNSIAVSGEWTFTIAGLKDTPFSISRIKKMRLQVTRPLGVAMNRHAGLLVDQTRVRGFLSSNDYGQRRAAEAKLKIIDQQLAAMSGEVTQGQAMLLDFNGFADRIDQIQRQGELTIRVTRGAK